MVGPIGFDRAPELLEAFFIGVSVLHDQRSDALGMLECKTPANRGAVVHDVHGVTLDGELVEQAMDQLFEAVKRVGEFRTIGHVALSVTRVVRGDHVIPIAELRDQVSEHMRRGREAVQQQHDRGVARSCFPIKDLDAVDHFGSIMRDDQRFAAR